MSDVVVSRMDIRSVVRAIERVDNRTIEIDSQVDALSGHQIELRNELQNLAQAFREFVAADKHAKALQLAETRIVKVRQEIETRFGFYGVVRRRATGILQGIDSGVVTHDVVRNLTEDMMVSAPGYWLAPALVALASWARDDQRLAARALDEALIRDSFKTSLFFALVTRRLRRDVASASWLTQYFRHQDPMALDREFMVLLDAVANGAFGGAARIAAAATIYGWLEEMSGAKNFVAEQVANWRRVLGGYVQPPDESEFPLLSAHLPAWEKMSICMGAARLHDKVRRYFEQVFAGAIKRDPRLEAQIDGLLDSLVTNFDEVERPLRRDERRLQLIIDNNGDEVTADREAEAEKKAFDEHVALPDLFANAAMGAEQSKASVSTQRFAVALSRDWITSAHAGMTSSYRDAFPTGFSIEIGEWRGHTTDGKNEEELVESVSRWVVAGADEEAATVTVEPIAWVLAALAGVALIVGIRSPAVIVVALVIAGMSGMKFAGIGKRRQAVRDTWATRQTSMTRKLRAVLAELVDFLRAYTKADATSEGVQTLLSDLSPDQFQLVPTGARSVVPETVTTPAAG